MVSPTKSDQRKTARAARRSLSKKQRRHASLLLAARLCEMPCFLVADTVLVYCPTDREISPLPALELRGTLMGRDARVAFPRVTDNESMECAVCGYADLKPGYHSIGEPPAKIPTLEPALLDVVLVPGVAFDGSCARLGYGKGFYDRFLAGLRVANPNAVAIGLGYDETLVDTLVCEPHDARLDYVVTPSATFRA